MRETHKQEFARRYNYSCGLLIKEVREKRKISREELASGIVSNRTLKDIEDGVIGWKIMVGDALMNRLGISTEYVEVMASMDELKRWHLREEMCCLVLNDAVGTRKRLALYKEMYVKRVHIEEQFLEKMKLILWIQEIQRKSRKDVVELLAYAKKVVEYTVHGDWEYNLNSLLLAPMELEAILLVVVAYELNGEHRVAWRLLQEVQQYPKEKGWESRMQVLILPQIAIVAMRLSQKISEQKEAWAFGESAFFLLRENASQRYALPLLEELLRHPEWVTDLEWKLRFRDLFLCMYENYDAPKCRLWQIFSINQVHEIGLTLRMLRKSMGKSHAKVAAETGELMAARHLEKIECGKHKPSSDNYKKLMHYFHRPEDWGIVLLDNATLEELKFRQKLSTLIARKEWEQLEDGLVYFESMVDTTLPRNRQEVIFMHTTLKYMTQENTYEECAKLFKKALWLTVPRMSLEQMKWWVFQREECMLTCNIALMYRMMRDMKEALRWYEAICHSINCQVEETKIPCRGYITAITGHTGVLGEMKQYEESIDITKKAIKMMLRDEKLQCVSNLFYDLAWNWYEIAKSHSQREEICQKEWRENFSICECLATYVNDEMLLKFLDARQEKYSLTSRRK